MDDGEITSDVGDTQIFAQILNRFPESVMITAGPEHDKPEEEILFVNKQFEEMTGYEEKEALGETPKMLQGTETSEQVMSKLTENISEDRHFVGETTNYRKSGEPYQVRWSIDALESDEGSGVTHWISIQRDTSDDALTSGFL